MRYDVKRTVVLTFGLCGLLREYFKIYQTSPQKKSTYKGGDFCSWAFAKVKTSCLRTLKPPMKHSVQSFEVFYFLVIIKHIKI